MKQHYIPFQDTGYFSKLIGDYLDKNPALEDFYNQFPDVKGFRNQLVEKSSFNSEMRIILSEALEDQYKDLEVNSKTLINISNLKQSNTFTVTTGHQLNIFTGPLYFLYKIVATINLTNRLKKEFPSNIFVPVYWMATEDHDFEEINFFNFKDKKLIWEKESSGAVGRFETSAFEGLFEEFSEVLGSSINASYLKDLFEKSYLNHSKLTDATRYLVNELFGSYGLVIVDGDDIQLKREFSSVVKDELLAQTSFKEVSKTNELLGELYTIQVNPRELNLFYLKDNLRERIILKDSIYVINNTNIQFSEPEILDELEQHPERFSPNVIMRPVYQETILPNLCYIGGGGELAYWLQLKSYFDSIQVPFPILLLRNSVLMISEKQHHKLEKLNIELHEIFCKQGQLIDKKVKEISSINIDFSKQKYFLHQQFEGLKDLAQQTDPSFMGAVKAQEKKQLNGLDTLEKRLLKAQKKKLTDEVERIKAIQNMLFPNQSLEERNRNFSEIYLELGPKFIPMLMEALDPLKLEFSIIEY